MIREDLENRHIPSPYLNDRGEKITDTSEWEKHREKLKELICYEEYGNLPEKPDQMYCSVISSESRFCGGDAILEHINMTVIMRGKAFTFPFNFSHPNKPGKFPAVVVINFRDSIPDRYIPSEELNAYDVAIASFCYKDITTDDDKFTSGFAGLLYPDGTRGPRDAGKIAIWAWAAMRVLDYLETRDDIIDLKNVAVAGHSRLGKTALLAGALDERFSFVYSNDSGCSGAAISRDKVGEDIKAIYTRFGFWFCENYGKYQENEHEMPFDQHYLHALVAPRYLYVASAELDQWADPQSEYLACVAASDAYDIYGLKGFVHPDRYPEVDEIFHEGAIGHHLRRGTHYFSRRDWIPFLKFMKSRLN